MNREQAAAFIQSLNLAQPFVPPVIFAGILNNPATKALEAMANGIITLEIKSEAARGETRSAAPLTL